MDRHNFIRNIPMYAYVALTRWFYFSTCLFILFIVGGCIVDIPLVWQWYQKKSVYDKQKNIYTKEQEMLIQQQNLQNDIKKLEQQTHGIHTVRESRINFLRVVLENQYKLSIISIKQVGKAIILEGIAADMNSITDGFKKLGEETSYTITLQSVARKSTAYVFHAMCRAKK